MNIVDQNTKLAFEIIEAMRKRGYVVQLDNGLDGTWEAQFYIPLPVHAKAEPEMHYGAGSTVLKAVTKAQAAVDKLERK